MSPLHRLLGCLALVGAIVGCGQAKHDVQQITTAAPAAAAIPTATLGTSPAAMVPLRDQGSEAVIDPGTYVLDQFPVDIAFDIPRGDPPGWHVGMSTAESAIVLWFTPPDYTYLFAFWNVDNVYTDPCDGTAGELDPPIGPSVEDLVAALSNRAGLLATTPVDVTVGAFRGKQIELTARNPGGDCPNVIAFSSGDSFTDFSSSATLRLQVLDVDGVRIVMSDRPWIHPAPVLAPEQRGAPEGELEQILDSIRVEPTHDIVRN